MSKQQGLGIIGVGKMGESLLRGLQATRPRDFRIEGTTGSKESAKAAAKRLGIPVGDDSAALAGRCAIIVLAVKPYQAQSVLKSIARKLTRNHLIISICASITTEDMEAWTGGRCAVVRAMSNTPAVVGEAMTVICGGSKATDTHLAQAQGIFEAVGRVATVEEHLMDGVTGLSGSGPAYAFVIMEALSEAGVKVGLPRKTATLLAAQTLLGAAKLLLEKGDHPAALKDEVTTPAGCTIDGLMALEEGKLRVTLIKAVVAAARRSRSLRES